MIGRNVSEAPRGKKPQVVVENFPGNRAFRRQLAAEARGKVRTEQLSFAEGMRRRMRPVSTSS